MPIVVVLAFALASHGSSGKATQATATAPVSIAAPTPSAAAIEPCAQVLSALPVQLDGYLPRIVHPAPDDSAPVVAWGNPAIVLQCGVPRPPELAALSSANVFLVDDVNWLVTGDSKTTIFTSLDRAVYVALSVPKSYAQPPLATIADAVATALPPVCHFPADEVTASGSPSSSAPGPAPSIPAPADPTATPSPTGPIGPLCTRRP